MTTSDNPANAIDPDPNHRFIDAQDREYYRHMDGTVYCGGSRVLRKVGDTFVAESTSREVITMAAWLYGEWGIA